MTLRDWLGAALHDLAPAAQDRVAGEYAAHVHDAMDSGLTEAQAVATLGDPGQVNRALRRTYATRDLTEQYRRLPVGLWVTLLLLQLGYGGLMFWNNVEVPQELPRYLAGPTTGLTLMLTLTWSVLWRPDPYRWTLGARLLVGCLMLSQWITALLAPGQDTLDLIFLIVLPLALTGLAWDAHRVARRVSRTLSLEGPARP